MNVVVVAVPAAVAGAVLGRPLANLTLTVADRANPHWVRGGHASAMRTAAVAVVSAGFAALAGTAAGWSVSLPAWLALALVLAPLAVVDVEHHRLPNRLVLPGYAAGAALLGLAALLDGQGADLVRAGLAGALVFALFAIFALAGGIGFGDVKLVGLLAGYLGWLSWADVLLGIFTGFVLGALSALALTAARRARWHSQIAFGPSLMLGALLVAAAA